MQIVEIQQLEKFYERYDLEIEDTHNFIAEGVVVHNSNAQIYITDDGQLFAGSRNRWLTPEHDNYGFYQWVQANISELMKLGPGRHYGEWWGAGIQRRYGMTEKRFSLFNIGRWMNNPDKPECCHVVPLLYQGEFTTDAIDAALEKLRVEGSVAAPGWMDPEGIVVYHTQTGGYFKQTLDGDGHKGQKITEPTTE